MSKLSEHPSARHALQQPLIHIAKAVFHDTEIDTSRPVPVLCFMGNKNPKHIAKRGTVATCKLCITLALTHIELLQQQAALAETQQETSLCLSVIGDLREILPVAGR